MDLAKKFDVILTSVDRKLVNLSKFSLTYLSVVICFVYTCYNFSMKHFKLDGKPESFGEMKTYFDEDGEGVPPETLLHMCQKYSGGTALAFIAIIPFVWPNFDDCVHCNVLYSQFTPFKERSVETFAFVCSCVYLTIGNIGMHAYCFEGGHFHDASGM